MEPTVLKLYVTGQSPRSIYAVNALRELCESELGQAYEMIVIDVLEHPELAEQQKILATPTLIKELPPPRRRVIGDLSDRETVLRCLDLRASSAPPPPPTPQPREHESRRTSDPAAS